MPKRKYIPHWILVDGALPVIGSGFRNVLVNFGKRKVYVKSGDRVMSIHPQTWETDVRKVEDTGQDLKTVLEHLRGRKFDETAKCCGVPERPRRRRVRRRAGT